MYIFRTPPPTCVVSYHASNTKPRFGALHITQIKDEKGQSIKLTLTQIAGLLDVYGPKGNAKSWESIKGLLVVAVVRKKPSILFLGHDQAGTFKSQMRQGDQLSGRNQKLEEFIHKCVKRSKPGAMTVKVSSCNVDVTAPPTKLSNSPTSA